MKLNPLFNPPHHFHKRDKLLFNPLRFRPNIIPDIDASKNMHKELTKRVSIIYKRTT